MRILALVLALVATPLAAQPGAVAPVTTIDPSTPLPTPLADPQTPPKAAASSFIPSAEPAAQPSAQAATANAQTFAEDDVLGAAEDVFGKGVEGLAEAIRKSFASYGQPNAYIVGREAGGAFIVGLRYGSGTLHHKVEGERPVHWAGPSVGVDVGGDGSKVFALVYNLNDTADLFTRFAGAGGKAYFVGGVAVDYLSHDKIVVAPIKLGVGLRLGLNGGYVKFTEKADFNPF
jgi:hypothetical protein